MILGVSLDSVSSQHGFHERECLPFDLLADKDGSIARAYKVDTTNLLIAKLADRVTFVIGKDGLVLKTFDKVKPAGHATEVLEFVRSLPGISR